MTSPTDTDQQPFDPLSILTMGEMDAGSRLLRASLVDSITSRTEHYERALAVTGYLLARRTDRDTTLPDWLALTYLELHQRLQDFAPGTAGDPDSPTPPSPGS